MQVPEVQIPCIVDQGLIFNKRDMARILQCLDEVEYAEVLDGAILNKRNGFIVDVFESDTEATIFFNRRIHINVNSFEYLKIHYSPQVIETTKKVRVHKTNSSEKIKIAPKKKKLEDYDSDYSLELVNSENRSILIRPLSDPIDNPGSIISEIESRRRNLVTWEEVAAEVEDD
jgi:hypothetical protein